MLQSSEVCHHVAWNVVTNISEEHPVSIFREKVEAACSFRAYVTAYQTRTQCYNPQHENMNLLLKNPGYRDRGT
jgi:hypothetical protein